MSSLVRLAIITPIVAEVLDKEPSVASIWILFGSVAVIGFLVCRYWRWWPAPLFLIGGLTLAFFYYEEFKDIGLLESSESPSYVLQFYLAAALAIMLPAVGAAIKFAREPQSAFRQ